MSFPTAIATCLSKPVTFEGRASRSEYWWFYLFSCLCVIGGLLVDVALGIPIEDETGEFVGGPVFWLVMLALALPYFSVSVRRLHDLDRSGWWFWIQLIPFIGGILYLIWMCTRGTDGENDYGPDVFGISVEGVFE